MLRLVLAILITVSAAQSARALDMGVITNELARYVQAQTDTPAAPAPAEPPVEPSEDVKKTEPLTQQSKKSLWAHNRSIMYMLEDGTRRR